MISIVAENPGLMIKYKNRNTDDRYTTATIGQCLRDIMNKYDVDISQRYKGLGEVKPQLMFYSTLNPKVRKLVRLTMEDREEVLREMRILHGEKFAEERRQMLLDMELDPDDIDN